MPAFLRSSKKWSWRARGYPPNRMAAVGMLTSSRSTAALPYDRGLGAVLVDDNIVAVAAESSQQCLPRLDFQGHRRCADPLGSVGRFNSVACGGSSEYSSR